MSDESSATEPLPDGWGPDTPPGDTLLRDYLDSGVRYLVDVGRAVGAPVVEDEQLGGAHHRAPFPFANLTYVRRPLTPTAWADALHRLRATYAAAEPFVVVSPFATPDLRDAGATLLGHPPFMVRPSGDPADRPTPPGLELEPVTTPGALADFGLTLAEAYPGGPAGTLFTPGILDVAGVTLWMARLDGRPVGTAAGHHGGRVNGVEMISCLASARGRRLGEAITWAPTLVRPELPATLFSSDLGRRVYERMGYLAVSRFTLWLCRA